ncbi:MAG: threonine synthase [Candidatus Hodarchaeota archaeon]
MPILRCSKCGLEKDHTPPSQVCPQCRGVFEVVYDFEVIRNQIDISSVTSREPGVWKYFELLPVIDRRNLVSLGEGGTFLHECDRLTTKLGLRYLYLKDETTNPTGSFIDRGTSVEISKAKELGFKTVSCGSSGNLAASVVAYAAKAGMKSQVFVPQRVDIGKLYQIIAYQPNLEIVKNREEGEVRIQEQAHRAHPIIGHSPYFLEGIKTTGYEICEQLNWIPPDWIVVPMGNGCHISMIWKAVKELQLLGWMEKPLPKLIGVQAKGCAPIVSAFQKGSTTVEPSTRTTTIAIDIGMKNPSCGKLAIEAIRESKGFTISVSDSEILNAVSSLASSEGVFAEPASAATVAALYQIVRDQAIEPGDKIICVITGMGLKYPEIAQIIVKGHRTLEQLLGRVEKRKYTTKIGETKLHILKILQSKESYGYAIWKTLMVKTGVEVSVTSVYQHLNELTRSGLITRTRSVQTYRKSLRHYYDLTEKGRWTLTRIEELEKR